MTTTTTSRRRKGTALETIGVPLLGVLLALALLFVVTGTRVLGGAATPAVEGVRQPAPDPHGIAPECYPGQCELPWPAASGWLGSGGELL